MKYLILFGALTLFSACDAIFGVNVKVPVGDNATVGIEADTTGETKVGIEAVIKP